MSAVGRIVRRSQATLFWCMQGLPKAKREAIYTLYAFVSHLDNIADMNIPTTEKQDLLKAWKIELDNIYDKIFLKEDIIKKGEKIPNKIKLYLDKGKDLNKDWNDNNKLISNINSCIDIENNIQNIIEINDAIKSYNTKSINILFLSEEKDLNNILQNIKKFGIIGEGKYKFIFNQNNNYKVNNNGVNITKIKSDWNGLVIGNKEIPKNRTTTTQPQIISLFLCIQKHL